MYPNPEIVRIMRREREQVVIQPLPGTPRGLGPQTQPELLALGTRLPARTHRDSLLVVRTVSMAIVVSLIALLSLFAGSAAASGPLYCGALNMVHDATMLTIPMVRNNPAGDPNLGNGNAGMGNAVAVSCTP